MRQDHKKSRGPTRRDKNDRYETPDMEIDIALRHMLIHGGMTGPVLEPACGSGRMVRRIREKAGLKCIGQDIEDTGHDFLARTRTWPGEMITNPPYHKDMPMRFVEKAHEVVDGKFAMLLQAGFLWTDKRSEALRDGPLKPEFVIVIPWRIYFYRRNGKRIEGQAYSHCWVLWPNRRGRMKRMVNETKFLIAEKWEDGRD